MSEKKLSPAKIGMPEKEMAPTSPSAPEWDLALLRRHFWCDFSDLFPRLNWDKDTLPRA